MAPTNQPTEPIFNSAGDPIGENDTQATGDTGQAEGTETEQTGDAGDGSTEPDPGTDGEGDGSATTTGDTEPPPPETEPPTGETTPEGEQPGQHDDDETKKQLYERATELEIEGRSTMSKDELIEAINQAEKAAAAEPGTDEPTFTPQPGQQVWMRTGSPALRVVTYDADAREADIEWPKEDGTVELLGRFPLGALTDQETLPTHWAGDPGDGDADPEEPEWSADDRGNVVDIYRDDEVVARIDREAGETADRIHWVDEGGGEEAKQWARENGYAGDIAVAEFDQAWPDFPNWFARVQKTEQFNGRPIPEPSADWEQAYRDQIPPAEAADKLGLPKA